MRNFKPGDFLLDFGKCAQLYYFLVCRFWLFKEVTWQILLFNCFLVTVGADFALCVVAVSVAAKLRGVVRKTLYDV